MTPTAVEPAPPASAASPPRWVPVIRDEALQEGHAVRAWADGTRIVVGRLPAGARGTAGDDDGECFAALDLCPHLDLPLAAFGPVPAEGERLVCPWHRWEFDVRTGRCEYASLYADDEIFFFQLEGKDQPEGEAAGRLHVLPARVRGGYVEVAL